MEGISQASVLRKRIYTLPFLRFILLIPLLAAIVGSLVALFLLALDAATRFRMTHPSLVYGLPFAGVLIVWLYKSYGKGSEAGTDLLIEDLSQELPRIPGRMGPLVFFSSILTHLFGGSAGREGTAVQVGASLAHKLAAFFRLSSEHRTLLLYAGMGAGFGAVFGTPLTATVFALEVVALQKLKVDALVPVLFASLLGDWFCSLWPVQHAHYSISHLPAQFAGFHWDFLKKILLAALLFGLAAQVFASLTHEFKKLFHRITAKTWVHPLLGGSILILLCFVLGTRDYLGLGVFNPEPFGASIQNAFETPSTPWSWFWKLLFTAITLSAGFKGGEATPLFFVGACLGSGFASAMGVPIDIFAALGFVAVFSAATKTPYAGIVMGIEMFGAEWALYFALVVTIAYLVSGKKGVYRVQRVHTPDLLGFWRRP